MQWLIDYHSGVPVYLQLVAQVKAAVASGVLRNGDQLPSVRALSEELRVNRNTVAKAYGELEAESVIENRQGSGCFVHTSLSPLKKAVRTERLTSTVDALIVQAHTLQIPEDALRALLDQRLREFSNRRHAKEE